MTEDNPRLVDLAIMLHRLRDEAALREASDRLLAMGRDRLTEDFRDRLHNARRAARRGPEPLTGRALEARIDVQQDAALAPVLEAMRWVGGPEVVAFCLELAASDATRIPTRRRALDVLLQNVDPRNAQQVQRRDAIAAYLRAMETWRASSDVAAARRMGSRARYCFQRDPARAPQPKTTTVRLELEIDDDGTVVSAVAVGDAPATLLRCIEDVGLSGRFPRAADAAPNGAPRRLAVPFSFVSQSPG